MAKQKEKKYAGRFFQLLTLIPFINIEIIET